MSDYDIEQAVELSAQAWVRSQSVDWLAPTVDGGPDRVYCGMENRDTEPMEGEESSIIRLPCVICICHEASPVLPNFHGNWNTTLRLEILSAVDDTTHQDHAARVRDITELFLTTSAHYDLSNALENVLYVHRIQPGSRGWIVEGRRWSSWQEYSLISAVPGGLV